MKVGELRRRLALEDADNEVVIVSKMILGDSWTGTEVVDIKDVVMGFDWDDGRVLLHPEKTLMAKELMER